MQEVQVVPAIINSSGLELSELPRAIVECGAAGRFAWEEWLLGQIRNSHTRKAYLHAVKRFLAWIEPHGIPLPQVTPGMVGRYFEQHTGSIPTKKLHMAAIRTFFDALVLRHVVVINPALSVKTERYSVTEGKTPLITVEQARTLLASIPMKTVLDYRDRAIISMLIYTAVRVGAVSKLNVSDLTQDGNEAMIRFHEKRGKVRVIPVRSGLQQDLENFLIISGLMRSGPAEPFFRSSQGRTGELSNHRISTIDISRMIKRRLQQAELPRSISCHSFRACAATDLLEKGAALDDVQQLLGHADARVTRLYDRRQRHITRNIVERISV